MISLFAGIAIFLSALGLLGLSAFAVEQRAREVSIRKVLGAKVEHIAVLVAADFVKMVLLACVLAFPVAWYFLSGWLQGFAYRIVLSPAIFLLSGGAVLLIALLTIAAQVIKAALANPIKALRNQ